MAFRRIVDALAGGGSFELYGDGRQSRSFTFVSDAVAATVAAMDRAPAGAIYNVGGGGEATMREAVELVERIAARRLDVSFGPPAAGDLMRTAADTSRIRADVGWEPAVELEAGLAAQWEWASARVAAR